MDRLRVVTLNIWNRMGPWEQRFRLIREGLRALDADIVGLQEVLAFEGESQAKAIAEALREDGLHYELTFGKANELGGGVLFGNAVLSRFPITKSDVFPLPNEGTRENRSLLMTELETPAGALPFFVTHLNWKFHEGYVREAQVVEVARVIKNLAPIRGLPPILVGDLNAEPEANEIRFLKGLGSLAGKSFYMDDCFAHAGQGSGITFDAVGNPFAATTREYPRRIDYILVRGPDEHGRGKPLTARVVLDRIADGIAASDHYGVYAEVSI